MDFPSHPNHLTLQWLNEVINTAFDRCDVDIDAFESQSIGTGKLGCTLQLHLSYRGDAEGLPHSMVAKFSALDEHTKTAIGAQGAYRTEVLFYQRLASLCGLRTPRIFGLFVSDDGIDSLILMEDLSHYQAGDNLQSCTQGQTHLVLFEAAKLVASTWQRNDLLALDNVTNPTLNNGAHIGQAYLEQCWPHFLARFGDDLSVAMKDFAEFYIPRHASYVLQTPMQVICHGDLRSENVMFGDNEAVVVDWQTVRSGSALTDVSYFLGGSLSVQDRRRWERELIECFQIELHKSGVVISVDECWQQYRHQAMHGLMNIILGASFAAPSVRSDAMYSTLIQRHLQHCIDLECRVFLEK